MSDCNFADTFQVFLKMHGKSFTLDVHKKWTIDELIRKSCDRLPEPIRPEELQLVCEGKQLQYGSKKTFKDYKIEAMSNLYVVFRLHGGYNPTLALKMKKEGLESLPGFITITTTESCIVTLDDDETTRRAKMPCGHVIGSDGMTAYAQSHLSAGSFVFKCPEPNCNQQWEWFMIRHVAAMSPEEKDKFEKSLADNYIQKKLNAQQCPGCRNYCIRMNKKDKLVQCMICTHTNKKAFQFCWSCLSESDGGTCTNGDCDGTDPRLKVLRNCPLSKMGYTNLDVPSIRACPKCGILYSHDGGCKQMVCPSCKCKFCFVCLKVANFFRKYTCGSYKDICNIAPRQTNLSD